LKVVLLPQARADLDTIYDPLYTRVIRRLRLLEKFPELGSAMTGPFVGFRSTVVGLFRIVYRVSTPKVVEIAYIRHCRRPPPA
jgi:plasmid stabilization system protein ParE